MIERPYLREWDRFEFALLQALEEHQPQPSQPVTIILGLREPFTFEDNSSD